MGGGAATQWWIVIPLDAGPAQTYCPVEWLETDEQANFNPFQGPNELKFALRK
jgi:hypothetical protein